ncbi:hypothetical protein [Micromonospora sp. b486]|uniref:PucR family transcriptional regulator n=1 Tax=Micromonospora sp. b486 TaxID=3053986 RepID=UPI003390550D
MTSVEARGNRWGRLVLLCDQEPPARTRVLLERAASTIALNQLVARDSSSVERQARSSLLLSIVNHSAPTRDVALRARGLGVVLEQRRLLGVVVRRRRPAPGAGAGGNASRRELLDAVETAVRECGLAALAGDVDEAAGGTGVTLLVALDESGSDEAALGSLSAALTRAGHRAGSDVVVAAGSVVRTLDLARRSLAEAAQVADATVHTAEPRPFYRLHDVRLRGLLYLLRDDVRLQTFVERELGPLLSYDQRHGTNHVALLETYLVEGRNKRRAADAMSVSRSALYTAAGADRAGARRRPGVERAAPVAARGAHRAGRHARRRTRAHRLTPSWRRRVGLPAGTRALNDRSGTRSTLGPGTTT